jgi:hypothetical protein
MSSERLGWYSLDSNLKGVDQAPVDLARAREIAEEYYARGLQSYVSGEEAVAATMFGFSRSPSVFIEICVNGASEISYTFEYSDPAASWLRKVFGGTYRFETVLPSKSELLQRIEEFFSMSAPALKAKLEGSAA